MSLIAMSINTDVHDAERSGRPSVITDALKQKVNGIIRENRYFTISEVYEQCPEVQLFTKLSWGPTAYCHGLVE